MFVVKYSGAFGFIKPWTAVRDSETFSQQFLTPSIVEGMEKKLFPELLSQKGIKKILRHKLNYVSINRQQEVTQTRGWELKKSEKRLFRSNSILVRGIMISPSLYLAFSNKEDAEIAATQHICLCRNEDILYPEVIEIMTDSDFDQLQGFELAFDKSENSFMVGFNRFDGSPMYGTLKLPDL
jgi:hypothetical protein